MNYNCGRGVPHARTRLIAEPRAGSRAPNRRMRRHPVSDEVADFCRRCEVGLRPSPNPDPGAEANHGSGKTA